LSVYALAIEKGIVNWASVIEDSPVITDQSGKGWPSNVNGTYVGNTDVCYAIAHSLNTVAVKVLDMVGREEALSFLRNKLLLKNLDEEKDTGAAALALGQPTYGLTLREMTAAYSVFQEGIMSKSRSYYLVTDSAGRIILNNAPSGEAVMSRETAAIMTKLMEEVVDSGTAAGKITLDDHIAIAGKSGTSQGNRDRYFIGYTPQLLAGVWFGYDYPKDLSVFGGNVSVYLWNDVMTKICEETDYGRITDFTIPDTVRKLSYPASPPVATENGSDLANGWFRVHISK
jgi:membrane peptidoglycan carboxypeptidase